MLFRSRLVLLRTIDSLWVEHLTELDDMRRGIGLRGYAQQDPLNEFKREAFQLYDELRGLIRHGVASSIFRVTVTRQPAAAGGGDPAVAASLARGAASLRGGNGSNGSGSGARSAVPVGAAGAAGAASAHDGGVAKIPASAAVSGSAILRGGPGTPPTARPILESLGDQPLVPAGSGSASPSGPKPGHTPGGARIGRNDPCWCGSGAKYKKCHGR